MCTDGGLVKYNGNQFVNYNSGNGLPDNTIFEVKEDHLNRIWFRSFSGKIGYIQNDTIFCPGANNILSKFTKGGIISSFAFDKEGNLFLGKRNRENISFLKIEPPYNENNVTEIWVDKENLRGIDIVLIGEDIVYSDVRGDPVIPYAIKIYDNSHRIIFKDSMDVKAISLFTTILLHKNHLYLGTNSILRRISLKDFSSEYKHLSSTVISIMPVDSLILIGKRQGGISSYAAQQENNYQNLSDKLTFTAAIKDLQGGEWFSTLEEGVFYMPPHKTTFSKTTDSPGEQISFFIPQNDSTFILGFNTGKITSYHIHSDLKTSTKLLFTDKNKQIGYINIIHLLSPHELLVCGSLGSLIINPVTKKTEPSFLIKGVSRPPKQIVKFKDSLLCLHLNEIKICDNVKNYEAVNTFLSDDRLTVLEYDSVNNKIYAGGLRGLYLLNHQKKITGNNRLLNCRIQDIQSKNGVLFIATNSEGLIIKRENIFDTINETKGLISNICKAITVTDKAIWVSTNKGISKITIYNSKNYQIKNYPLRGFIEAASISRIVTLKNTAYFFSAEKVYAFPSVQKNVNSIFRISSLTINNKLFPVNTFNNLKHGTYKIKIDYEALFYDCNKVILYRYKLNRNAAEWNYTNETSITLPNPSPGEYEFIVEAKNNNGEWIRTKNSVAFTIEKPFWQKLWFILLLALIFSALIGLILWNRYLNILKKEREKNSLQISMYELESRVAKAQMNPHFIFNSLNSIQQFILANENDNAYRYLSKFSKLVRKLLESNTYDSITIEEEIDILKRYVEIESLRFEDSFVYDFFIDKKLRAKNIKIPHMLIQPFIENAIWHGLLHKKDNKKLDVSFIYYNEDSLMCTVEDNGVGRKFRNDDNLNINKRSLAIELIRQRMQLLQKTKKIKCGFEITDKINKQGQSAGTLVTIIIPILKENENITSNNY